MGISIRPVHKMHPDNIVSSCTPLFINELTNSVADKDILNKHIHTQLSGDMSIKPTCNCRHTVGHVALSKVDTICPKCNTKVCTNVDRELAPTLFLKCPTKIDTLLLPNFVQQFRDSFGTTRFDTLSWLVNTNYRKYSKTDKIYETLTKAGVKRGWNNFTNNIEHIMLVLLKGSTLLKSRRSTHDMLELYRKHKHSIHTQHIYFPSSILFVIETTAVGNYLDFIFALLKDAVLGMTGVDLEDNAVKQQNIIGRNMIELGMFYSKYLLKTYGSKPGLLRTALMSAKGIYVSRAVVTSITRPHNYDEIELPWASGISLLRTHIMSVLMKRKMSLNDAMGWIQQRVHTYCPDMASILRSLVAGAGRQGLPCTVQRFPSLTTGSFVKMYVSGIKEVVSDLTASFSIVSVRSFNMDFDGDSLHISLLNDQMMSDYFEPLEYHYNLLDPLTPRKINGNLSLSNPVVSNCCDWVDRSDILSSTPEFDRQMMNEFG